MSVLHSKRIPSADQAAAMLSAPADIPGQAPGTADPLTVTRVAAVNARASVIPADR